MNETSVEATFFPTQRKPAMKSLFCIGVLRNHERHQQLTTVVSGT